MSDGDLSTNAQITINLNDVDENVLRIEKAQEMEIYPNPASSTFTLQVPNQVQLGSVQIISLDGKMVKRYDDVSTLKFNIDDVEDGTYLVLVEVEGSIKSVGRLIKKR